jgi:hypothetical protein
MTTRWLGGWQRLWVSVSVLYLGVVCMVGWLEWPTQFASIEEVEAHLRSGTDVHKWGDMWPLFAASENDERRTGVRLPDGRVVRCSLPKANTDELENACAQAVRTYWHTAETMASQTRWHHVRRAGLWWAIPVGLLYLLGRLVDWTYRGFRP